MPRPWTDWWMYVACLVLGMGLWASCDEEAPRSELDRCWDEQGARYLLELETRIDSLTDALNACLEGKTDEVGMGDVGNTDRDDWHPVMLRGER